MRKDDLFKLLETEELKNNTKLHKELHILWEKSYDIVSSQEITYLSIESYEYLLKNNVNPHYILKGALNLEAGEKRDQSIDLILNYKIDWTQVYYYNLESISTTEAQKFLDNGASTKLIIEATLYQKTGEKRDQLLDLALTQKIDWSNVYLSNPQSISIAEAEKLLNHGANGKLILKTALVQEAGDKRDQLLDLALTKKIDWRYVSSYDIRSLTLIEAEKLLDKGAESLILKTALVQEAGDKRDQLLDLALTQKIDWRNVSSYDIRSITLIEAEKLLDKGASESLILETALVQEAGEKRDQLLDLALTQKIDWSNVYLSNPQSISIAEAEKLLNHGANGKLILKTALVQEAGENRDQLIDLALTKKIDWRNVSSYDIRSLTLIEAEKLLDKGASESLILETALVQEAGDKRDQLLDLALTKKIDWNKVYLSNSGSISIIDAEKLLDKGASGKFILETAFRQEAGENRDQLIKLALTKKIDWNNFYISSSISKNDLELCLNSGLPSSKALSLLLNSNYSYNETLSKEVQHQIELIEFLVERGTSFKDVYSIPSYFPYETYQYLLEHGLNANHILSKVFDIEIGERHDQLLDLALTHKANLSKIWSIGNHISKTDLDKMINNGLNPTKILELISSDNFIEFFDYLTEKGIDLNDLKKLPADFSYEQYQEILTKGINPDILLQTAGYLLHRKDQDSKEKSIKLIKLALDNGADINADYGNGNLISATMDPEILDFLIERGAKCTDRSLDEITENGLTNILFNPQITSDKKFKNLDAEKAEETKIPYILHQIWLTSPESPREIREQDLKIALETHETFMKSPVQWQQIVWTNDKTLFPKTVQILEDNGVQVKSIYDHQDELASFEMIENLIAQQKWGMASDALRYVLVNEFGGVYADLNFNFNRDTTDEAHKYNYFTQEFGGYYIDNFFFGASPNHPIIQKIVEMVERNIVNPPKYIANIKDQTSPIITDMATANPTFIAYYLEANKDDNIDVVYPKSYDIRESSESFHSESIDFFEEREFREAKEINSKYCPDLMWMMNLGSHLSPFNNMCVAERFIIGEDSTDGRTWVSE